MFDILLKKFNPESTNLFKLTYFIFSKPWPRFKKRNNVTLPRHDPAY